MIDSVESFEKLDQLMHKKNRLMIDSVESFELS